MESVSLSTPPCSWGLNKRRFRQRRNKRVQRRRRQRLKGCNGPSIFFWNFKCHLRLTISLIVLSCQPSRLRFVIGRDVVGKAAFADAAVRPPSSLLRSGWNLAGLPGRSSEQQLIVEARLRCATARQFSLSPCASEDWLAEPKLEAFMPSVRQAARLRQATARQSSLSLRRGRRLVPVVRLELTRLFTVPGF